MEANFAKAVISGSIVFQEEYRSMEKDFSKKGIELIDYPRSCQNLDKEYPEILTTFFKISQQRIYFLYLIKIGKGYQAILVPQLFQK